MELLEGLIQLACLDAFDIEIEAGVERVVDVPADCVVSILVGRLGVGHQVQRVE